MSDEWDFEAIDLPAGCWVHSKTGDLMLPGGSVVGKLSESGLRALELYLDDLARLSPPSEPRAVADRIIDALLERYVAVIPISERERLAREIEGVRRAEREECAKIAEGPAEAWGEFSGGTPERDRIAAAIRGNRND